jgi:hypothetical protein
MSQELGAHIKFHKLLFSERKSLTTQYAQIIFADMASAISWFKFGIYLP